MIENISPVAVKLVEVALDGLALQQRVLANNIANANTSGFIPQRMDFESALRSAANQSSGDVADDIQARLSQVDASINSGSLLKATNDIGVQLDLEMAGLNQTVLKYEALIQALNQYNSMTAMAISGDGSK